jgi:tRNA G46 methylase TrmB
LGTNDAVSVPPSVAVVRGSALSVLALLARADVPVGRVIVNFPDPWPRRRHAHKRILSPEALGLLASCLVQGGTIRVVTDSDDVVAWTESGARALAAQFEIAAPRACDPAVARPDRSVTTAFERVWRARDLPIREVVLERR